METFDLTEVRGEYILIQLYVSL